jgi:ankyrin repeat protein
MRRPHEVQQLIDAVRTGDGARVAAQLEARPEIINMDASADDEHRALHYAVLARDAGMVRVLMTHGADARIGIYPHRVPTTALAIATERRYDEIVEIIREAEERRPGFRPPDAWVPDMPHELREAIEGADVRGVIASLESNPTVISSPGPDGITMLHIAAGRGMPDLAAWLLERGADANANPILPPIDMLGRWPVGHPQEGVMEVAELLLQHGAERTPFWAVATGNTAWLRARHAEGALSKVVPAGGGLVGYAVRLDRPEMLTLLLDLGFDPDERAHHTAPGGTPLERCARERRVEMAEILLERGATMTVPLAIALGKANWIRTRHAEGTLANPAEGDGLLTVAVESGRREMVELLLALGFDADERRGTASWGTPLARAAAKNDLGMAELLLAHGADPNGTDNSLWAAYRNRDRTMLDLLVRHGGQVSAATAAYHRDVDVARQRIQEEDAGRLPPAVVPPGRTVAEELLGGDCGEPEIIRMALARIDWPPEDPRWYGALRGPRSFWSHVPWIRSPEWDRDRDGYLICFRLILARTHANQKGSFGRTILHDVMAMGHHDGVSGWITEDEALAFAVTLLDAGARTDVRDDLLQSTPLGWACRWGRTPIVRELLNRGVDSVELDAQAWATPRAWAEKMGHRDIARMLST